MKSLKNDQSGFFTMIAVMIALIVAVIYFVYTRVANAG